MVPQLAEWMKRLPEMAVVVQDTLAEAEKEQICLNVREKAVAAAEKAAAELAEVAAIEEAARVEAKKKEQALVELKLQRIFGSSIGSSHLHPVVCLLQVRHTPEGWSRPCPSLTRTTRWCTSIRGGCDDEKRRLSLPFISESCVSCADALM